MTTDEKIGYPPVRNNAPFIGIAGAQERPFISLKKPFVGIGLFAPGFTFIELLVTVTVAGILMMIAVPAMTNFLRSNRLAGLTNEFIADLQLARSEAIKRSGNVIVCKSTDGATCTGGGTWTDGWVVFADTDASGGWSQTAGKEDVRLKVHEALSGDTAMSAAAADIVIFARGIAGAGSGDYTLCDPKLHQGRTVTILPAGRVSLKDISC